jgi:hypothetical protein
MADVMGVACLVAGRLLGMLHTWSGWLRLYAAWYWLPSRFC